MVTQESIGVPSTSTAQQPQLESSQPRFEPVRPRSSRRTSSSSLSGGAATSCHSPFAFRRMSSLVIPAAQYANRPSIAKIRGRRMRMLAHAQCFHAARTQQVHVRAAVRHSIDPAREPALELFELAALLVVLAEKGV